MNKGSLKVQNCIPHPLSGKKNHLLIPEYPMTPAVTLHSEPADAVPVLVDFFTCHGGCCTCLSGFFTCRGGCFTYFHDFGEHYICFAG